MLADLSVIPVVPDLKAVPPMNVEITLDDEFTSKFIKSKGALSESDTFHLSVTTTMVTLSWLLYNQHK